MKSKNDKESIIRIGISSCLLGEKVRYDSGHKLDRYITDVLGKYFSFVPVCPEVEVGMGVPREPVHLAGDEKAPRMVGNTSGEDWTDRMIKFRENRLRQLEKYELSGYILKKDSPSCGMERVKIYKGSGAPSKAARGLWGGALVDHFPPLPIEEEGRLNDHRLRENFIVRVFAYNDLLKLFKPTFNRNKIVEFHTRYKFLMLAHSPKHYRALGQMVASIKKYKPAAFAENYGRAFMDGLKIMTTTRKNVNVLMHMLGYLKKNLDRDVKADILGTIEDYHKELVPLVVPLTLLKHYINKYDIQYIKDQVYLNPHPRELMLRNHV